MRSRSSGTTARSIAVSGKCFLSAESISGPTVSAYTPADALSEIISANAFIGIHTSLTNSRKHTVLGHYASAHLEVNSTSIMKCLSDLADLQKSVAGANLRTDRKRKQVYSFGSQILGKVSWLDMIS